MADPLVLQEKIFRAPSRIQRTKSKSWGWTKGADWVFANLVAFCLEIFMVSKVCRRKVNLTVLPWEVPKRQIDVPLTDAILTFKRHIYLGTGPT